MRKGLLCCSGHPPQGHTGIHWNREPQDIRERRSAVCDVNSKRSWTRRGEYQGQQDFYRGARRQFGRSPEFALLEWTWTPSFHLISRCILRLHRTSSRLRDWGEVGWTIMIQHFRSAYPHKVPSFFILSKRHEELFTRSAPILTVFCAHVGESRVVAVSVHPHSWEPSVATYILDVWFGPCSSCLTGHESGLHRDTGAVVVFGESWAAVNYR